MKWTIHNTLVCPHSGVAFSSISSLRFLKFILWYEADILLLPGDTVKPDPYLAIVVVHAGDVLSQRGRVQQVPGD